MYAGLLIFIHSVGLFAQDVKKASGQTLEPDPGVPGKVIINGVTLSAEQVMAMEQAYGAKPLPGNYWYDTNSGLYGVVGYPSYGFMLAGDDFGELKAKHQVVIRRNL